VPAAAAAGRRAPVPEPVRVGVDRIAEAPIVGPREDTPDPARVGSEPLEDVAERDRLLAKALPGADLRRPDGSYDPPGQFTSWY
jgi:hypothetical protein